MSFLNNLKLKAEAARCLVRGRTAADLCTAVYTVQSSHRSAADLALAGYAYNFGLCAVCTLTELTDCIPKLA